MQQVAEAQQLKGPRSLTTSQINLAFYKRHGFRISGAGAISTGGPNFWGMMRAPAKIHRNAII